MMTCDICGRSIPEPFQSVSDVDYCEECYEQHMNDVRMDNYSAYPQDDEVTS